MRQTIELKHTVVCGTAKMTLLEESFKIYMVLLSQVSNSRIDVLIGNQLGSSADLIKPSFLEIHFGLLRMESTTTDMCITLISATKAKNARYISIFMAAL